VFPHIFFFKIISEFSFNFPHIFFFPFLFQNHLLFFNFICFFSELFLLIFSNYFVLSNVLSSLSSLNSLNFPFMNRNVIEIKLRNEI
jgi:hypothetical protein